MNIHGNEFEIAAGDLALELKIDLALNTIKPNSVSYVRTNKKSGTKCILIQNYDYTDMFNIDTGKKGISFEDVWPEIRLRVIFS